MSKIERSILEFLHDILEFATGLQRNISSISKQDFFQNEMAINYAEKNFEKIGEAVSQIQKRDPNILFIGNNNKSYWENTKGVRNRIIHEYWGTSLDMIYDICVYDLDKLKEYVQIVIDYLENKVN